MTFHPDDQPACHGRAPLFESEHPNDHRQAKQLCDTECPVKAACQRLLEATIEDFGYGIGVGPRGTWAGQLLVEPRNMRRPRPDCGTAAGYQAHKYRGEDTCDKCRAAEAAAVAERRRRKLKKEAAA